MRDDKIMILVLHHLYRISSITQLVFLLFLRKPLFFKIYIIYTDYNN